MRKHTINVGGRLVDLSTTQVMGIVNITDDSFYEGSRVSNESEIESKVAEHLAAGATIIDIGGCSTRPGSEPVSTQVEIMRVLSALDVIEKRFGKDINISIDTYRSEVVRRVIDSWGRGFIVNDIEAGYNDKQMLQVVGDNALPYIAMHSRGDSKSMDSLNGYEDIVDDILHFFVERIAKMRSHGIVDIILDLGFGFAKDVSQNFELIRRFTEFGVLGYPLLAGISRKRVVWQSLELTPEDSLNGTTVLNTLLVDRGASILRVHDSKEATEAIKLINLAK